MHNRCKGADEALRKQQREIARMRMGWVGVEERPCYSSCVSEGTITTVYGGSFQLWGF